MNWTNEFVSEISAIKLHRIQRAPASSPRVILVVVSLWLMELAGADGGVSSKRGTGCCTEANPCTPGSLDLINSSRGSLK